MVVGKRAAAQSGALFGDFVSSLAICRLTQVSRRPVSASKWHWKTMMLKKVLSLFRARRRWRCSMDAGRRTFRGRLHRWCPGTCDKRLPFAAYRRARARARNSATLAPDLGILNALFYLLSNKNKYSIFNKCLAEIKPIMPANGREELRANEKVSVYYFVFNY